MYAVFSFSAEMCNTKSAKVPCGDGDDDPTAHKRFRRLQSLFRGEWSTWILIRTFWMSLKEERERKSVWPVDHFDCWLRNIDSLCATLRSRWSTMKRKSSLWPFRTRFVHKKIVTNQISNILHACNWQKFN